MSNPLQGTDGQLMLVAALRYCLGRQSYIVGAAIDWFTANWGLCDRNSKRVIVRDVCEALRDDHAGSPGIDAPGWKRFAEKHYAILNGEDREWVYREVTSANRLWPLETR